MQKVITVTTHANLTTKEDKFIETEFPILNNYLTQGYTVKNVFPVVPGSTSSYMYSLTFVLEKSQGAR